MSTATHRIISGSPAQRRLIKREFNTGDIIRVILFADKQSGQFVHPEAIRRLKGHDDRSTLQNIYRFVKGNVNYRTDPRFQEDVRSPGYLFQSGAGDCKSLSIAIGALCRAFGIPYKYRFIRQRGNGSFHHVYVVATPKSGGREILLDAVASGFDTQPDFVQHLDLKPGAKVPAGISGTGSFEGAAPLLILLLLWFAFAKKVK